MAECNNPEFVRCYNHVMNGQTKRAKKIGPGLFCMKPITPHHNPNNAKSLKFFSSRQIPRARRRFGWIHYPCIVIMRSSCATSSKTQMRVQLLVCDYNFYIVGLRRLKDHKWSQWYRCSDISILKKFNAISIGISRGHRIMYAFFGFVYQAQYILPTPLLLYFFFDMLL
jgi:hypothetical protein